jgi:hypothetical protein
MEANFGFGKLYYPTEQIEEYIEPYRLKIMKDESWPEEGWEIFQCDTNIPDEKYIHPVKLYKKTNINYGYYLQTQHIADVGKLHDDIEADIEARKLGFIVDEYGIVQGYGDRNLVFEANPGYIEFLINKIEEEPTIYKEMGYVPIEIKNAFPELARSVKANFWDFKKEKKYMKTTFDEFMNESVEPGKWFISYGLGGGFGGADNHEVIDADNQEQAEEYAYEMACQEYDSYAGLHGLRDLEMIMDEDECEEEEAEMTYNVERESWLDYSAEPIDPEKIANDILI